MTRARVLLADDHRIVAEGLRSILIAEFELVDIVGSGEAMVDAVAASRPEVVVADISMPVMNGIDAMLEMRKRGHATPVIFLTMHREIAYARRALEAGAAGYVLKHAAADELAQAIRAVLGGGTFVSPVLARELFRVMNSGEPQVADPAAQLTPRQREILHLYARGFAVKEIARKLEISPRTVEFHKYQMMETLGARSSSDLIHFAIRHGFADG